MGQAVATLLGSKREDKTVAEGVESHFTVLDRTFLSRRVRLEFTIIYPNKDGDAAAAPAEEAADREFASRAVIEEVSSQSSVLALEEEAAAEAAGGDDECVRCLVGCSDAHTHAHPPIATTHA